MASQVISVEYLPRVAVITIRNDKRLGALTQQQYYQLSQRLREVATHDEVYVTVLVGSGRFFSACVIRNLSSITEIKLRGILGSAAAAAATQTNAAARGADVSTPRSIPEGADERQHWLQTFVAFNLNITQAFASHPKILVVGLNGPVIGLSAALVAHADFIYAAPHTFLLTPFSSIGLVAEGGASQALVSRLGPAKANEALIMSRRISADELKQVGFVNEILHPDSEGSDSAEKVNVNSEIDSTGFRQRLLKEVNDRLGDHLVGDSLLGIKKLIRRADADVVHLSNYREVFDGLDRFLSGVPQEQFRKLASGEKRHKL